jgi:hypothetical protein
MTRAPPEWEGKKSEVRNFYQVPACALICWMTLKELPNSCVMLCDKEVDSTKVKKNRQPLSLVVFLSTCCIPTNNFLTVSMNIHRHFIEFFVRMLISLAYQQTLQKSLTFSENVWKIQVCYTNLLVLVPKHMTFRQDFIPLICVKYVYIRQ